MVIRQIEAKMLELRMAGPFKLQGLHRTPFPAEKAQKGGDSVRSMRYSEWRPYIVALIGCAVGEFRVGKNKHEAMPEELVAPLGALAEWVRYRDCVPCGVPEAMKHTGETLAELDAMGAALQQLLIDSHGRATYEKMSKFAFIRQFPGDIKQLGDTRNLSTEGGESQFGQLRGSILHRNPIMAQHPAMQVLQHARRRAAVRQLAFQVDEARPDGRARGRGLLQRAIAAAGAPVVPARFKQRLRLADMATSTLLLQNQFLRFMPVVLDQFMRERGGGEPTPEVVYLHNKFAKVEGLTDHAVSFWADYWQKSKQARGAGWLKRLRPKARLDSVCCVAAPPQGGGVGELWVCRLHAVFSLPPPPDGFVPEAGHIRLPRHLAFVRWYEMVEGLQPGSRLRRLRWADGTTQEPAFNIITLDEVHAPAGVGPDNEMTQRIAGGETEGAYVLYTTGNVW